MIQYTMAQWDKLLESSIAKIKELSKLKGGEYAGDHDRLANFRDEAKALDLHMETIWCVYVNKYWAAVKQYVKDLQHGTTRPRMESISGRLDDIIVYSLLFKAMIEERKKLEDTSFERMTEEDLMAGLEELTRELILD